MRSIRTTAPHRTLAASALLVALAFAPNAFAGDNLILNAGAEEGEGSPSGGELEQVPHWTNVNDSSFTVVQYAADNGGPSAASPGPADRGLNYFAGGPNNEHSSATQLIQFSDADIATIAAGGAGFVLSGWLGGFSSQDDNVVLSATFFDTDGAQTDGGAALQGPFASDRGGETGLSFQQIAGTVSAYARSVLITLDFTRVDGDYNDGSADNLSFVLGDGAVTIPTAVPEPSTYALMLGGLGVMAYIRRRRSGAATSAQ